MRYIKDRNIVVMDLIDLEHCGFNHDDFDFELKACGVNDPEARWPVALVVNFAGGGVVTLDTSENVISNMKAMKRRFDELLSKIL